MITNNSQKELQHSSYLMEDPREAFRLASKVKPEEWVERYLSSHLGTCKRVLDVGCGPGVIAHALAKNFPFVEVAGLDISADRIRRAKEISAGQSNATWRQENGTAISCEDNAYDLLFSRFLFEYLPEPRKILQEMKRVCRSGGTILLQDLDGQLVWHYPPDLEIQNLLDIVLPQLRETGFDPFVGRKLYTLAHEVGFKNIRVKAEPYHLIAGPIDDHEKELWALKLDIALPVIAKATGDYEKARSAATHFLQYLEREDTLTYSTVFTVIGTKP